jgi:hypothetical protein
MVENRPSLACFLIAYNLRGAHSAHTNCRLQIPALRFGICKCIHALASPNIEQDRYIKRFTALQFTALATLWLGHASTCAALPEPDYDIAECSRRFQESLKSDLKDPRAVGGLFVTTKFAELLYSFDDSAQELAYPHFVLLENAAENKRKPRVSNAQSKEAEKILEKGQPFDFIQPSILNDVGLIGEGYPDTLHYKCIFDAPTFGGGFGYYIISSRGGRTGN